jgi:hypothetical protein
MLPQNLKVHIRGAHKSAVAATRKGGSSALDLIAIKGGFIYHLCINANTVLAFYDNRLATLKGEAADDAPVLAAPTKLARVSALPFMHKLYINPPLGF